MIIKLIIITIYKVSYIIFAKILEKHSNNLKNQLNITKNLPIIIFLLVYAKLNLLKN